MARYVLVQNELYHHGVKGQKWGIRRSLAELGHKVSTNRKRKKLEKKIKQEQKRILKEQKRILKEQENAEHQERAVAKKRSTQLSDEDLVRKIDRLTLEKRASELERDTKNLDAMLHPKKENFVKKFAKETVKDVVAPAAKKVGKDWLEKKLEDVAGLNNDKMSILKKQAEVLKVQKEIADSSKSIQDHKLDELRRSADAAKLNKTIRDSNNPSNNQSNKDKVTQDEINDMIEEWFKNQNNS